MFWIKFNMIGHRWIPTSRSLRWLSALGMAASFWATPVLPAEQIRLSYPPFGTFNISVSDLENYAKTGVASPELNFLLRLIPTDKTGEVQQNLNASIDIEPTTVTQFINSPLGQVLFERIGRVFQTGDGENGAKSLTTALKTAAASPDGITVLTTLRGFPDQTIQIDGQFGLQALGSLFRAIQNEGKAAEFVERVATVQSAVTLPDLPLPQNPGQYTWQKQTISFVNPQRGTAGIPADIYVPKGLTAPAPLIVISHGLASDRMSFAYLAKHLASQGFAVVAVTHPGSDANQIGSFLSGAPLDYQALPEDWVQRPLDLKYAIDAVAAQAPANPTWKIDTNQVGLFGQSMGGYTVLAAAGAVVNWPSIPEECQRIAQNQFSFNISLPLQCRIVSAQPPGVTVADPRVKAVIAVNPVSSTLFGSSGFAEVRVPIMLVAGSKDIFAPPLEEQIRPFTWLQQSPKFLTVMKPGTHFSTIGVSEGGVLPVPQDLIGPNPELAQSGIKGLSSAFFNTFAANEPQFRPFLSQTFANTLSENNAFQFFIVDQLNANQLNQVLSRDTLSN